MGGTLMVAGMGCYIVVLISGYEIIKNHKIQKRNIIMLIVWIGGALINAAAPGNFARHSVIDKTGVHPISALEDSVFAVLLRCSRFIKRSNYISVIIICILCGFIIGKKVIVNIKEYNIISILCLITPVITAFPAVLGYSNWGLPNRCIFLVDFTFILSLVNFCLVIGIDLSKIVEKKFGKNFRGKFLIILTLIAIVCFPIRFSVLNTATFNVGRQIVDGTYSKYYKSCSDFYELLKVHKGEEVRISKEKVPASIGYMYNFYLSEDPLDWVNTSVANYYGLKSICIY